MATLQISRKREYINMLRNYRILIDGTEVGQLGNGESKAFEVSAGSHEVVAKIDWCSSPEISVTLTENQVISYAISGYKFAKKFALITYLLLALHIILSILVKITFVIYLLFPLLLLMIYAVTWGRKKYLSWEEVADVV